MPAFEGRLDTAQITSLLRIKSGAAWKKIDPSGPLPDRYVQSNYEAMNALKLGMEKSKFEGRKDTMVD